MQILNKEGFNLSCMNPFGTFMSCEYGESTKRTGIQCATKNWVSKVSLASACINFYASNASNVLSTHNLNLHSCITLYENVRSIGFLDDHIDNTY